MRPDNLADAIDQACDWLDRADRERGKAHENEMQRDLREAARRLRAYGDGPVIRSLWPESQTE